MNWNKWMRLSHRWLSVAFTVPKPSSPYPNPPSPSYAAKCPRSTGSCGTGTLACARRLSAAISAQLECLCHENAQFWSFSAGSLACQPNGCTPRNAVIPNAVKNLSNAVFGGTRRRFIPTTACLGGQPYARAARLFPVGCAAALAWRSDSSANRAKRSANIPLYKNSALCSPHRTTSTPSFSRGSTSTFAMSPVVITTCAS